MTRISVNHASSARSDKSCIVPAYFGLPPRELASATRGGIDSLDWFILVFCAFVSFG